MHYKLNDIKAFTHKGIVSASGYSNAAILKAKYHNIDLFHLKDIYTLKDLEFKHVVFAPEFKWCVRCNDKEVEINSYKILVREGEMQPYVACCISLLPDDSLVGMTVSNFDNTIRRISISAADRNRRKINLQLIS